MLKIVLSTIGLLAAAAVAVVWLGSRLPSAHRARTALRLAAAPEAVYARISDVAQAGTWRKDVKAVELLPVADGEAGFRLTDGNGTITYRIERAEPPHRFVTRIADTDLGFGGRWTIEVLPDGSGSRVAITEDGEVSSPVFRFFSRHVFGHYRTQEAYLAALAASFGETARSERLPEPT
ncbi:SRPBCC family protein [Dokdonella koreensis]|uniref:Polyketide cyclase/dehydrase and lipid transport n=1 Tax=Dokdonella koreensis DS-123 TaxID=1300342 RepID=A0A161HII0_9GAMM|nr:SRPBCC family protein [Dokdonella koreensis]ANB16150.1 Polyketide cyclase/dehydrase and lipid transport [Dokdonella koreensis DS-123]